MFRSITARIIAILSMGFVSKELYIYMILKRIDLKKKALIMNLDGNQPVYIDRDITQKDLPASFRYYNFALNFI